MSHFLDRLQFFKKKQESFSDNHGEVSNEDRSWEQSYRQRWQHDKIVRSTHGVNCTGSCSWKIYVKNGLVTWETQQTDYPETRPDLPNHEPRGCPRGASYSWYLYSANRLRYPLIRKRLLKLWRAARAEMEPVEAWHSIVSSPEKTASYKSKRGMGGFVRAPWDEMNEIIAAANVYTAKEYGPDRVVGFSPIPAMSMASYAAGTRYLSLIGGTCLSFYDWYCDLPPSSPQVWGEQTDVPESADWYNSNFLLLWGSNVPQTRTPDAHFYSEARYKGVKSVVITPDFSEASKFADIWLAPKQGTDAALAMAFGHVILKKYHIDNPSDYFIDYVRQYTDMPMLVCLEDYQDGHLKAGRFLRAADIDGALGQENNPEWKTMAYSGDSLVAPNGSIGFRWGEKGRWNLEEKEGEKNSKTDLLLTLIDKKDAVASVAFPYFGAIAHEHFNNTDHGEVLYRNVPVRKFKTAEGQELSVATVYDLMMAHYSIDRGLGGDNVATSFLDDVPYTPGWQQQITGVKPQDVITVAEQFAENAHKTQGKSMVIVGAGLNHWYHQDMNYRSLINMLMMCGCVGQSGGGWAHYVGQEKLRPQTGWQPLAFALDWQRPPRQMNGTSFFYSHSDQWRYEKVELNEILSPLADQKKYTGSVIDYNVRAERMGWLPSAPQLATNPLGLVKAAQKAGQDPVDFTVKQLESGALKMACEDPDDPQNFPRNMFIWRSNLLGSSGKGHEYLLKHLLGTRHGLLGKDLGEEGGLKPEEVVWHEQEQTGKLDLLVTLDFRMSTTCLYSDIVLPTATWYEKDDMNTSDMHPFIHPLSAAVDPAWEARSDWDIYKGIAKKFSEVCVGHLGVEKDVVTVPTMHDTPGELGQPLGVTEWAKGECAAIPGKTMPNISVVERDYPNTYKRFTALGPLMAKLGNGGKGIHWNTEPEVELLGKLNHKILDEGVSKGMPAIETAINACEVILTLAPETNGQVAVKAWEALGEKTGRDHTHLAKSKEDEKIRFRDIKAQPRKIISSPIWSGLEDEHVSYNAGYTNVHELIPWRTITGRQQFYQDHEWMIAFGEGFSTYRPPIDTKTVRPLMNKKPNGHPEIALNWITPHQKWGIHSTYTDNLLMLTLSRGGPIIWMSEIDAKKVGLEDNDWVEAFNVNGALTARVVVSQRVNEGMTMMYHAQERTVNVPGSETTGTRGGMHNSVTRTVLKPTHMIGSYAQQSYGFNYYGTVGSNRDEFVIVRKMNDVDWLDEEPIEGANQEKEVAQ
ncbi:MAG: nitrate reductase subunit alpha [Methylococcales bacterium]|jgi:nitrate reductase alpha subunit|nr:nitrate reductase subunit alpha [Methylococcales bacterium]MBT4032812.1 nitrate reductase subunit alpha [Methylococcales bacterium]MBT4347432.1 nitrate reductase subunit alpha [Methylococcales bacterium]MBT4765786.1 nitrate reductase subunit alpha [Methylococcales bacterium]MBT6523792.1 nitrate reductase subunit alpha [Methylococcales bacterium]